MSAADATSGQAPEAKTHGSSAAIDLAKTLSPSGDIDDLVKKSVQAYKKVKTASNNLLTKSSLDLNAFRSPSSDDDTLSMRQLIVQAAADFTRFAQGEIDLCNNLNAYGGLLVQLVPELTVEELRETLGPMVGTYQTAMAEDAKARGESADLVLQNIEDIQDRLDETSRSVGLLSKQAAAMESQLEQQQVGKRLITALKKLFKLVDDEEGALVQLSVILGLSITVLRGDFSSLFKDTSKARHFIDKVNALNSSLEACAKDLIAMTESMKVGLSANVAMVDVWNNLAAKIDKLNNYPDQSAKVTTAQKVTITMNWHTTTTSADKAVTLLSGALSEKSISTNWSSLAAFTVASFTTASPRSMKIPQSESEINLLKAVGDAGLDDKIVDPEKYKVVARLASTTEFMALQYTNFATFANSEGEESHPEVEELFKKFGAPGIEEQLQSLASDCNAVSNTFDTILQVPFLQNLVVLNPFYTGNNAEQEKIDLRTLFGRYKGKYLQLQEKTKEVVRQLISYAAMQLVLLENVEPNSNLITLDNFKISIDDYINVCTPSIKEFEKQAAAIQAEHTAFNNEWEAAKTSIQQKINECKKTAEGLRDEINKKRDEYKSQTIWGVLKIIGGVACFTATFLVPFLAPITLAAGGALMAWGIKDLIDRGKLGDAIRQLEDQFNAAQTSATQLEQLKNPMQLVSNKLAAIIGIWLDINRNLKEITARQSALVNSLALKNAVLLGKLWGMFLGPNKTSWKKVEDGCTAYVSAIF